jgi:hypothetical protein
VLPYRGGDPAQHLVEISRCRLVAEVDEADAGVDFVGIEELELLLVPHHLQRRLTQHREVQRRPLGCRQGKHQLMCQRGFAGAGRSGDDVERILRQPAAEHFVESRHAGGQAIDLGSVNRHGKGSCAAAPAE